MSWLIYAVVFLTGMLAGVVAVAAGGVWKIRRMRRAFRPLGTGRRPGL